MPSFPRRVIKIGLHSNMGEKAANAGVCMYVCKRENSWDASFGQNIKKISWNQLKSEKIKIESS